MGAAAQEMRLWTDRLEGQVDSLYALAPILLALLLGGEWVKLRVGGVPW